MWVPCPCHRRPWLVDGQDVSPHPHFDGVAGDRRHTDASGRPVRGGLHGGGLEEQQTGQAPRLLGRQRQPQGPAVVRGTGGVQDDASHGSREILGRESCDVDGASAAAGHLRDVSRPGALPSSLKRARRGCSAHPSRADGPGRPRSSASAPQFGPRSRSAVMGRGTRAPCADGPDAAVPVRQGPQGAARPPAPCVTGWTGRAPRHPGTAPAARATPAASPCRRGFSAPGRRRASALARPC